ncbi:restriction endonuclease subunit S [Fictibacillus enclensis]|uniref:restriction endonuclease subunit S n=1 Tax=Fictibacillus enclensis TaxID=1017270 RepID=UPI0024C0A0E2|nr:restriction endonuclease subunit S [Fictibacillus enclensis]WHY72643.1 restriction endonuclease subunit S [Fictibacillus enclensis]
MKNSKTPEVRFAGFTGEWKERRLGEIYTERKERGHQSLQILSVSIHHGVSDEELDSNNLGKTVNRSEDKSLYKHVYFGDLVLNMMRAWQGAFGVVKSEGMVSPAYITANPSLEIHPLFMDYCLHRDEMIAQMNNLSYGVTDFRKRLYWKSFVNVLCHIPSVPEQETITAFFTRLDNTIALYQQELNTFKQIKHGFLQKIFSQEIRFKDGGSDFPKWEKQRLGEISNITTGKLDANAMVHNGQFRFYTCAKEFYFIDNYAFDTEALLISGNGNVGYIHYYNGKFNAYQRTYVLDKFCDNDIFYIKYYLEMNLKRRVFEGKNVGSMPYIVLSTLTGMEIQLPALAEQKKIGAFFKKMDDAIDLHHRELEALKETKKAFLQKMFV